LKYKTKSIKIKKKIDEKRAITPWGRSSHAEHVCSLNWTSTCISYSFWNKGWKVSTFWKFDEKRTITPKWILEFTSKLQGG
jgi:hypothetical protein